LGNSGWIGETTAQENVCRVSFSKKRISCLSRGREATGGKWGPGRHLRSWTAPARIARFTLPIVFFRRISEFRRGGHRVLKESGFPDTQRFWAAQRDFLCLTRGGRAANQVLFFLCRSGSNQGAVRLSLRFWGSKNRGRCCRAGRFQKKADF